MANFDLIFSNIGAFICAVFVLEYGADAFIDHTAIVAKRMRLSRTLIALLTAGAEWEELAVVIAALAQRKPALALGNIIGSCISNILGAFSLGLLFRPFSKFDRSARVYALLQLVITTAVVICLATAGPERMGKIGGGILVASFIVYILSIAWGIYRGVMKQPEGDDSDSDDDHSIASGSGPQPAPQRASLNAPHSAPVRTSYPPAENRGHEDGTAVTSQTPDPPAHDNRHRLRYHLAKIMVGFLALSLSGYVLSHSAASLASSFGLSNTVVGLTILSFATTLPEKLVSLVSGSRGHSGILVGTTAGSNIFLLTLCTGVALLGAGKTQSSQEELKVGEIIFVCVAASVFTCVVWLGTQRWMGAAMFGGYVTFLALEFTIWRR